MGLYPLKFKPVYKDYIWGGRRIAERFDRELPAGIYAESWEVSAHPDGMSIVENGALAGASLADLVERYGAELLGSRWSGRAFPLLIKLIDADRNLSVQVHPHDDNAHLTGGEPKTEMWYILAAPPESNLIAGLEGAVDREQIRLAVQDGSVETLLHREPIAAGDVVYMPGGRVHAICAGTLILEVQQSSNTTYRLYDWGRLGTDGQPRRLHVDEALQVIHLKDDDPLKLVPELIARQGENEIWRLLATPYFEMERIRLAEPQDFTGADDRFAVLFCESGSAEVAWTDGQIAIELGRSLLLPASLGSYQLIPTQPDCSLLCIR